MTIEINDFDYQFFVKKQFILNVIMSAFVFFVSVMVENLIVKYTLLVIMSFYSMYLIFIFLKYNESKKIINYAKHRVYSYFFVCFSFLFISLGFSSLISIQYFLGYLFLFILIGVAVFYSELRSDKSRYDHILEEYYLDEERHSLFDFFSAITDYKNKKSNFSLYLAMLAAQFGVVIGVNILSSFSQIFKIQLMIGLFFFLSCFFLNQMRTYILIPYRFLLNKEKEQRNI